MSTCAPPAEAAAQNETLLNNARQEAENVAQARRELEIANAELANALAVESEGESRYSVPRTVAHNLSGMARDLVLLLRGRQGDHRCELNCEWVWDPAKSEPDPGDLLDGGASSWSVQLEVRGTLSADGTMLQATRISFGD